MCSDDKSEPSEQWILEKISEYELLQPVISGYTKTLFEKVKRIADDISQQAVVQARTKSVWSYESKLRQAKNELPDPLHQITDLCGCYVQMPSIDYKQMLCNRLKDHFEILERSTDSFNINCYIIKMSNEKYLSEISDLARAADLIGIVGEIKVCTMMEHARLESSKAGTINLDVFICSKSEDYNHAQRVYSHLVKSGLVCFLSEESLPRLGNSDYRREIDKALDKTMHMVVVTTSVSNVKSAWVEAEWGFFINEKRSGRKKGNLITVLVGDIGPADLPPSLRYYEVVYLDEEGLDRLCQYLC